MRVAGAHATSPCRSFPWNSKQTMHGYCGITPQSGGIVLADVCESAHSLRAAEAVLHEVCQHICKGRILADVALCLHACSGTRLLSGLPAPYASGTAPCVTPTRGAWTTVVNMANQNCQMRGLWASMLLLVHQSAECTDRCSPLALTVWRGICAENINRRGRHWWAPLLLSTPRPVPR